MNVKRLFGTILSLLGIFGLIYAAYLFMSAANGRTDWRSLGVCAILGLIFFSAGMKLLQTVKDDVA